MIKGVGVLPIPFRCKIWDIKTLPQIRYRAIAFRDIPLKGKCIETLPKIFGCLISGQRYPPFRGYEV